MWNHFMCRAVLLVAWLGLALNITGMGCGKVSVKSDAGVDATPGPCPSPPCSAVVADVLVTSSRALDLLFVVDDSASMAEEQAALTANFGQLVSVLASSPGGLPDLHIGVINADLGAGPYSLPNCVPDGENGTLQNQPRIAGCSPPDGAFIVDIADPAAGTRLRNYAGTLDETFACIAQLGTTGCGFEQTLESIRRALDGSNPANQGFLRPDANLGIIIISDEDDCSVFDTAMYDPAQNTPDSPLGPLSSFRCFDFGVQCTPDTPREPGAKADCKPRESSPFMYGADEYIQFVRSLKPSPEQILVAGIIGDPEPVAVQLTPEGQFELAPSCMSASGGQAAPGVRLEAFMNGFPNRSVASSICNENFSNVMVQAGAIMANWLGMACLEGPIMDTSPDVPGLQYECAVSLVSETGAESPLPACDTPGDPNSSSNLPCHVISRDVAQCSAAASGLGITVYHGNVPLQPGSHAVVECLVE